MPEKTNGHREQCVSVATNCCDRMFVKGGWMTGLNNVVAVTAAAMLLAGCGAEKRKQVDVSLANCLAELADVSNIAKRPLGKAHLISTYDRTGGNRDWGDFRGVGADGMAVLADIEGPGCVKRIWMTNIPADEWLIYLDGEKEPRIRMSGLFGKGAEPFLPPLCNGVSGGSFCYLPIPFKKRIRIVAHLREVTPNLLPFYQINYETYGTDVRVASFPKTMSADEMGLLAEARTAWEENEERMRQSIVACSTTGSARLAPGQAGAWLEQTGAGRLKTFWLRVKPVENLSALERERLLRMLVLRICWNGSEQASVETPLGDFFCNALHRRRFSAMPVALIDDTFVCRFPMEFAVSARGEVLNQGVHMVEVEWGYDVEPIEPVRDGLQYFHAMWNSSTASGVPYVLLTAQGSGHYVGCYVVTLGMDGSWNNLEADEAFWIDGESVASLHGTGLEDYFNGAWYYYGLFDLPLHGLTEKAAMQTCQYRFHVSDAIKFDKSLFTSFEFGHGNASRGYMSSVAYWYQPEPHSAGTRMPSPKARFPVLSSVERAALMAGLFELERAGLWEEARQRCLSYAERLTGAAEEPALRLRALAYEEELSGYDSVRGGYAQAAAQAPAQVADQAAALSWFHGAQTNALLGSHMNGRARIYLDGSPVGEDDGNPLAMDVFRVSLTPGEHEVALELLPVRADAWVSLYVRGHTTNLCCDAEWEYSKVRPSTWPGTDAPDAVWSNVVDADQMLPKMSYWQFHPNAFILMQSGSTLIKPYPGFDSKIGSVTTYLRRRFVVPE
jgi:hypothetical protein